MKENKRAVKNTLNWRTFYQLFSGILFIALGIIIVVRANGFSKFIAAGIFGFLLVAYGGYRIYMFLDLIKKARENKI